MIAGIMAHPASATPAPALVLCHGALDFKENFEELQSFLASRGIASLALDMRGHGASGGKRWHVDIKAWVDDIRCAVDYLSVNPGVRKGAIGAFGFSSGGTAVLEAAVVEDRLRCVSTLDATVRSTLGLPDVIVMCVLCALGLVKRFMTGDDLRLDMSREFGKVPAAADEVVNRSWQEDARVRRMWSEVPFPGIWSAFVTDTIRRVHRIRVPVLVIHGDKDRVDPPESAVILHEALRCPRRLCIVAGNGHMGHRDTNRHAVFDLVASWAKAHLV